MDRPLRMESAELRWTIAKDWQMKGGTMLELAEVVGLEKHLTVPSRGHAHLVDFWIAIKRSSIGVEWERQFTKIAQNSNARLSSLGFFQALPFTERRGWIVARCADSKVISPSAVENLVRVLVAEVNTRIATPATVRVAKIRPSQERESWTARVRTALADAPAMLLGSGSPQRREPDVDIASS